jgi:hypothetical protein
MAIHLELSADTILRFIRQVVGCAGAAALILCLLLADFAALADNAGGYGLQTQR